MLVLYKLNILLALISEFTVEVAPYRVAIQTEVEYRQVYGEKSALCFNRTLILLIT